MIGRRIAFRLLSVSSPTPFQDIYRFTLWDKLTIHSTTARGGGGRRTRDEHTGRSRPVRPRRHAERSSGIPPCPLPSSVTIYLFLSIYMRSKEGCRGLLSVGGTSGARGRTTTEVLKCKPRRATTALNGAEVRQRGKREGPYVHGSSWLHSPGRRPRTRCTGNPRPGSVHKEHLRRRQQDPSGRPLLDSKVLGRP